MKGNKAHWNSVLNVVIPNVADFDSSAGVPYSEDYSEGGATPLPATGFNRVGYYYLELENDEGVMGII